MVTTARAPTGGNAQKLGYWKCDLKASVSHGYSGYRKISITCEVQGWPGATTYLESKYVTILKSPKSLRVTEKERAMAWSLNIFLNL